MNNLQYKMQEYPGLTGAIIASLFGLFVKALASYGFELTSELEVFITAMIVALFPVIGAAIAQRWSTPLIRPKDNEGNELTAVMPPLPNVP